MSNSLHVPHKRCGTIIVKMVGLVAALTQANSYFVHLNLLAKDPGVALARIVC